MVAKHGCQISVQIAFDIRLNERLPVFGAKDHMHKNRSERLCHYEFLSLRSPFQGLDMIIPSFPVPCTGLLNAALSGLNYNSTRMLTSNCIAKAKPHSRCIPNSRSNSKCISNAVC